MSKQKKPGMSRREFVKTTSMGLLTVGFLNKCSDNSVTAPQETSVVEALFPPAFPQSVATGDPSSSSMVFWTRLIDPDPNAAPDELHLVMNLALDPEMTNIVTRINLVAKAEFDYCIKIIVNSLSPATTYYYQFHHDYEGNLTRTSQGQEIPLAGNRFLSKIGRTKTAPSALTDAPVKFGVVSCQAYSGRYYNAFQSLAAQDDLDFVLHLGDYIYETAGASTFQDEDDVRRVVFTDEENALDLGDNSFAARSLHNYRELYKIFRSDPMLQAVHEKFPIICTWDDHEFSNDSWSVSGTYHGGLINEADVERKINSERAYAEYMPLPFGLNAAGNLASDEEAFYPNTRIYRDFVFGRNLHLLITDTRTYRADHLIAEDAHPATVVADEAALEQAFAFQGIPFAAVRDQFFPCIDIDTPALAAYKQVLTGVATQQYLGEGLSQEEAFTRASQVIQGKLTTRVVNPMIDAYNATNPPQQLPSITETGLEVGLAIAMFGKTSLFSASGLGSRYFLPKSLFDLYSLIRWQQTEGASEDLYGAAQENWLYRSMITSQTTWRVIGNSIPMAKMHMDLSQISQLPPEFRQNFIIGADHFDGVPIKRREVLGTLDHISNNTVLLAGDIHSFYASQLEHGIPEFTVAGASSAPFQEFMRRVAQQPPFDAITGIDALVNALDDLVVAATPADDTTGEREARYVNTGANGYGVVTIDAEKVVSTFYVIDGDESLSYQYGSETLADKFQTVSFQYKDGVMTRLS